MSTNWFDSLIGFVSPVMQARRLRARLAIEYCSQLLRKYEGASTSKRLSGWSTSGASANTENASGLTTLRNRARDLVRNNCYAKSGVTVIKNYVVGTGIITQLKGPKKAAEKLDALWDEWAEQVHIDFEGRSDIYGLQNLLIGTIAEAGECLVQKRFISAKNGSPIPLQLQILEPDHLDCQIGNSKTANGNRIIQGVELDSKGKRVAYHLSENHPGDLEYFSKHNILRVPASDILQVYDQTRAGQVRGITWFAAAILKMHDLDEYEDAELLRQKIAACFTAFVHDADLDAASSSAANGSDGRIGDKLLPGQIEHLPPGKEVTFGMPPSVSGYKEFTSSHLMAIASSLGITYEAMTSDYSQVNYSSGRMGWIKMLLNVIDWQNRLVISQFMRPIVKWFLEAAAIAGYDTKGVYPVFTTPRREMIDPTKETPAIIKSIRAGLTTLPEAIKQQGGDFYKHLAEYEESNKQIDKHKLVLDSDPRKTTEKGKANEGVSTDEEN